MNIYLYDIFYLVANAFNTYVVYSFMKLFFKKEYLNIKNAIILHALYYLATSIVYIFFPFPVLNLIVTVLSLFLITFSYKSNLSKKIISSILIYLTSFISEAIVAGTLGITDFSPFVKEQYGDIFSLVIVELITFSFVKIISRFNNLDNEIPVPGLFIVTAIAVPIISIFFEIQISMQDNISDLMYCMSLICILALNFIILYLYDSLAKAFKDRIQSEVSKQKKIYYQNQAKIIQQSYENTQQLRHDIKNYGIALTELIKNNENEKALDYISSLSGMLEPAKIFSKTGLVAIDSIINYKFTKAEEVGISVDSEITIPYDITFKENDLVAILGNLLDNAIEATSQTENKYIKFHIEYDKGTVLIVLKNSFNGNLNISGNTYNTTKQDDSAMHGIGLKSIESALEKHNGEMVTSYTENEFSVKIILFL
ncbi:MAG: GHKL domain-containing protein [Ruminococcus sp.]|nr:GHKL domain-containing protein [Ruminococcus sp.]